MTTEFPGNSKSSRPQRDEREDKKIEPVVTNEVLKQKKTLGRRFAEMFVGGDSKSVAQYVIADVIIPQVKDLLNEVVSSGFEKMIYGDAPRPRGRFNSHVRPGGPTNYSRFNQRGTNPVGRASGMEQQRAAPESRGAQSHEQLLFATRAEADAVADRMFDLLEKYEMVSIQDLHSLVNWSSSYTDQNWGWLDLSGCQVRRVPRGYTIDFPRTVPIN